MFNVFLVFSFTMIFSLQLGIATALWFILYYSPQDIAYNVKTTSQKRKRVKKFFCWNSPFLTWSLKMSKMFPVRLGLYCIKGLYYPKKVQKQILISKRRFASNWVIKPPKVTQENTGVGRDEAREARPPRQLPRHDPYRLLQGQVKISPIANSNGVIAFDTFAVHLRYLNWEVTIKIKISWLT